MQNFISSLTPMLVDAAMGALALMVLWLMRQLNQFLVVNVDKASAQAIQISTQAAIDRLHMALQTGVAAAMAKDPKAGIDAIAQSAIKHAQASIPDTIAALQPTAEVLTNIALSKISWIQPILPAR